MRVLCVGLDKLLNKHLSDSITEEAELCSSRGEDPVGVLRMHEKRVKSVRMALCFSSGSSPPKTRMHEVHYVQQLPCADQAAWSVKRCYNSRFGLCYVFVHIRVLAFLILLCKHIQGLTLPRRPRRARPLRKNRRLPKRSRREPSDFHWAQPSLILFELCPCTY